MRIWLFSLLISLGIPALAAITVSDGDNQTLLAGSPSKPVSFKVVDELGNPTSGVTVTFSFTSITDSTGDSMTEALSVNTADTDNTGEVSSQIESVEKIGTYTLTASLATDETESASTEVTVIVGKPTILTVIDGADQVISVGQHSKNLQFQLTDTFGHAVKDSAIFFTLVPPESDQTSELKPVSAITDKNGQASTRLNADTLGSYLIIAHSSADSSLLASTKVFVTDSIPVLPNLGKGQAFDALGQPLNTTITFSGGISVEGNSFEPELIRPNDQVFVQGLITPDNDHIGQQADIIVIANYTPFSSAIEKTFFYLLNHSGQFVEWKGADIDSLVAFRRKITLSETQLVNIYGGQLITGTVEIWFGYRLLENGTIVAKIKDSISVTLYPPELGEAQAVNASGQLLKTSAEFLGGILVEGRFEENVQTDDIVFIQGLIKPDSEHIGKVADIIVVAEYIPSPDIAPEVPFYLLLDSHGKFIEWDGEIASLVAFKHNVTLSDIQAVDIYSGEISSAGTVDVWFGYRLENGAIIYNNFPISALIKKPPQSTSSPETSEENQ